jgi:hypothetical protein
MNKLKKSIIIFLMISVGSAIAITNIDGLYYLRDDNPGEPSHHEGSLLREPALEIEQTWCDRWIKFPFGEEGTYLGINRISNIYYHVWFKRHGIPGIDEIFDIGYSTDRTHQMDESIVINTANCLTEVDEHRLIWAVQQTDSNIACFEGDEIYNFTIVCQGGWPRVRTSPNQSSFVILNLKDEILYMDWDDDQLSNYKELFVYMTNPYDTDTDDDNADDYEEVTGGSHPGLHFFSDPNNYLNTTGYRRIIDIDAGGPYAANIDEKICFIGIASGGIEPYGWHWDFGDSSVSEEQSPYHAFDSPGNYLVTLTITDDVGNWDFGITLVRISVVIGDMNLDGIINEADIDPFVYALVDPGPYEGKYGIDPNIVGDINQDGVLNAFDVDPFIQLLEINVDEAQEVYKSWFNAIQQNLDENE